MDKAIKQITKGLFLALAMFPLMKENIGSLSIILCALFVIYDIVRSKKYRKVTKELILFTVVFWMYFLHAIFTLDFSLDTILFHLPFLIFPLLFFYRPVYINAAFLEKSLLVYKASLLLQCALFLVTFLKENTLTQVFEISNENIPFFRTYVTEHAFVEIHPTYFSMLLLISLSLSLFYKYKGKSLSQKWFNRINILCATIFIFIYASKAVMLILGLTVLVYIFQLIKSKNPKKVGIQIAGIFLLGILLLFSFKNILIERFDEVRTEINRPLVGDYHNSINIRVAIFNCSKKLFSSLPVFGYGSSLQAELNECYETNYDSNFYKISTYNTHNYYVHLLLYGGWLFLLTFLLYLLFLFRKFNKSTIVLLFLTQVLLINLSENFFSRHYGIIIFMYFVTLFSVLQKEQVKKEENIV